MAKTIYWYEYWSKQKAKKDFEKDFLSLWLMQFLEKPWKMWEILMSKPVCLGLSLLGLSKILAYEFWYD